MVGAEEVKEDETRLEVKDAEVGDLLDGSVSV